MKEIVETAAAMNISPAPVMKHFAFNYKTHQRCQSEAAKTTLITVIELTSQVNIHLISWVYSHANCLCNSNAEHLSWEL